MESKRNGMFNCQHINDEGRVDQWEMKYLEISEYNLIIKESADDNIVRSTIHLSDIVEIDRENKSSIENNNIVVLDKMERLDESNNQDETTGTIIVLHFKTRYRSQWKIQMESEEMFNDWESLMQSKKGIMREIDINPPPPPRAKKSRYTFKTFYDNRKMMGERWMIALFLAYTVMLVILFSVLWTKYVLPEKNIVEIETNCYIQSSDAEYVWKRNYNLNFYVTYENVETGETLSNKLVQFCSGNGCPDFMEEHYPVGTTQTCFYDQADPNYVFFDLSQMVRKRVTITFGVCGGLFGPWIIFVVVTLLTRRKTVAHMFRDSCCPSDD